jgi:hypothetical protein
LIEYNILQVRIIALFYYYYLLFGYDSFYHCSIDYCFIVSTLCIVISHVVRKIMHCSLFSIVYKYDYYQCYRDKDKRMPPNQW